MREGRESAGHEAICITKELIVSKRLVTTKQIKGAEKAINQIMLCIDAQIFSNLGATILK